MENLTNQILELDNDRKFFVLRQAVYKGITYYFAAEVLENEEDFTGEFIFLERKNGEDESFSVEEVTDNEILKVLVKNVKLD